MMLVNQRYPFILICIAYFTIIFSSANAYFWNRISDPVCEFAISREDVPHKCKIEGFANNLTVSHNLKETIYLRINHYNIPVWNTVLLKHGEGIQTLNLAKKSIESLEARAVHNLITLISLDLTMNLIKVIPLDAFIKSNYLKRLDLGFNNLTSIESIVAVKGPLVELQVQSNNITNISRISKLSSLRILLMNDNNNCILPDSLRNYNLTCIYLANNFITNVTKELFVAAKKLEILILGENQIAILEANTFEDLESLIELDLSSNLIVNLPLTIFNHNRKLSFLQLSDNKLEFLEHGIFTTLRSLKELHLNNNNIKTLDFSVFYSQRYLHTLYLYGNPLENLNFEKLFMILNFDYYDMPFVFINFTNLDCEKYEKYSAAISKKHIHGIILTPAEGVNINSCSESTETKEKTSTELEKIESILRPLLQLHITLTIFAIFLLIYVVLIFIQYGQKFIRKYDK